MPRIFFSSRTGISRVFVKDLDFRVNQSDLIQMFALFESILSSKVAVIQFDLPLGYGFVVFLTSDSAKRAINEANGMLLKGRSLTVEKFIPKGLRN